MNEWLLNVCYSLQFVNWRKHSVREATGRWAFSSYSKLNQYPTCNIFHKSVIAYKYCQDHAPFSKYLRNEDLYVGYMAMNSVANRKEVSIKFVFLGDRKYILQYNYVCPIFIWLECCPDFKLERELENCWRCNHGKRGHLTYQKKQNSD